MIKVVIKSRFGIVIFLNNNLKDRYQYGKEPVYCYTQESDEILVVGNNDKIYLLSERLSASKYSYQSPVAFVDETIFDEFYAEIGDNNPKAIVTSYDFRGMSEFLEAYAYTPVYSTGSHQIYMQSQEN